MNCVVCRCSDDVACELGCSWVKKYSKTRGLCSSCPEPVKPKKLNAEQKRRRAELRDMVERLDLHRRAMAWNFRQAQDHYDTATGRLRAFEIDRGAEYLS